MNQQKGKDYQNPPHIRISAATEEMFPAVASILDEACGWLAGRGIRQWTVPFSEEYIRERIRSGQFRIIELEGEPVGVFRLVWPDPEFWGEMPDDAAYVHTLAIRRAHAGRGLGKFAVDWALQHAREHGKKYLRLDCMADNTRLRNYYENLGFSRVRDSDVRDFRATLFQRPTE